MLVLSDWDLADAITFDVVRRSMRLHTPDSEEVDTILKGASYSKDYTTFSIWSLIPASRRKEITNVDSTFRGSITLLRVGDTIGVEVVGQNLQ